MTALPEDSKTGTIDSTPALAGQDRRHLLDNLLRAGVFCTLIASAPAIIACLVASFKWPLVHDTPVMYYIAWRILSGAVPYRDIFDMNMPGAYAMHVLIFKFFGSSNLGWRLFDLMWLLLTAGAIYLLCRSINRWGGLLGAVFFFAFHLNAGAINMGQRDYLLGVFLLVAAHFVAASVEKKGRLDYAFLAGLILGIAIGIKPHCLLFGGFLLILVIAYAKQERFAGKGAVLSLIAGMAVVPMLLGFWLAWGGGLIPLLEITFKYTLPFYSKLRHDSTWTLVKAIVWPNALPLLVALLASLRFPKSLRYWLIVGGVFFGGLSFVFQGKGYPYHVYPFLAFLYALFGISLVHLLSRRELAVRFLALLCFATFMYVTAEKSRSVSQIPMSSDFAAHRILVVNSLVDYLRPRFDPHRDTIQLLDEAEGGYHALFILRAVQPTRFVGDVPFLHTFRTPYARSLMAEFLTGLRQKRPKYIVVFNYEGQGAYGPDRLQREFPEIARLVTESYTLEHSAGLYFVFARK